MIYIIVEFDSEDILTTPPKKQERGTTNKIKQEYRQSMPDIKELKKRTRDTLSTPSPSSTDDPFTISPESRSPLHKKLRAFTSRLRQSVYPSRSPKGLGGSSVSLPAQLDIAPGLEGSPVDREFQEERITVASLLGTLSLYSHFLW